MTPYSLPRSSIEICGNGKSPRLGPGIVLLVLSAVGASSIRTNSSARI